MFDTDYEGWSYSTYFLYVLASLYVGAFLLFWMRFETLERKAKRQGGAAVVRYNNALHGFPNAVFAKMFGKRAFEVAQPREDRTE